MEAPVVFAVVVVFVVVVVVAVVAFVAVVAVSVFVDVVGDDSDDGAVEEDNK